MSAWKAESTYLCSGATYVHNVRCDDGTLIVVTEIYPADGFEKRMADKAALIASAPELLAALEELVRACEENGFFKNSCASAREIISKSRSTP